MALIALAQGPSDTDIQTAMERGKTVPAKKLWDEIKKKQQYRINRAGFGDPIEKKVLILTDLDRAALEAAEAKRTQNSGEGPLPPACAFNRLREHEHGTAMGKLRDTATLISLRSTQYAVTE